MVDSPMSGISNAWLSPLAVDRPTLSPVKLPGPFVTITASSWLGFECERLMTKSSAGMKSLNCFPPGPMTHSTKRVPSSAIKARLNWGVAVLSARITECLIPGSA